MFFREERDGSTKMAANEAKPEGSSRGKGWGGSKEWYGHNRVVNVFIQNVLGKGTLEEGLEGKKLDLPAAEENGLKRRTNPEG